MRNEFCNSLIELSKKKSLAFLTGDLGFMALEPLQTILGKYFINAGVAEQNMITVAAGLTYTGLQTWVYSIAPFCYARPFEQIRNDVSLSRFAVKLVGNGGGYAYGPMGGTHHALEDYGVLGTLPHIKIFVPAFKDDVLPIVNKMSQDPKANYLRLGRCEAPKHFSIPDYAAWRKLLSGTNGNVLICMGPLVGGLLSLYQEKDLSQRPEIWCVTELPLLLETIPAELLNKISSSKKLYLVEEHVANGGFGQNFVWLLAKNNFKLPEVIHAHAQGYLSGNYGSQSFHRKECGLDPESIVGTTAGRPDRKE